MGYSVNYGKQWTLNLGKYFTHIEGRGLYAKAGDRILFVKIGNRDNDISRTLVFHRTNATGSLAITYRKKVAGKTVVSKGLGR